MHILKNLICLSSRKLSTNTFNIKLFENKILKNSVKYNNKRNYAAPLQTGVYESPYSDCSIPTASTFAQHILEDFLLYDDLPAITDFAMDRTITYAQLYKDIHKLAKSLFTLGVRWGDVVVILSENRSEFATAFIASSLLGATVSTVNPQYTTSELLVNFAESDCKLLFTSDNVVKMGDSVKGALEGYNLKYGTIVFGDASTLIGSHPYQGLVADSSSSVDDSLTPYLSSLKWTPASDVLALPFSSGTTGKPKGTMISHFNFVTMIDIIRSVKCMNYEAQKDVILAVLPFFHIYAQTISLFSPLKSGCHIISLPRFEPKMFVGAIKKHKATLLHLVPPIFLLLAKKGIATVEDLSSVDTMITGAAPCSANLINELQEKLDIQYVRQGYGLTEMSPMTHCTAWDDTSYGSCGPSCPNTKWKIVHPKTHEIIKDIEVEGELCVQGPQMMLGYLNNEKATNETIIDGWLHTGDIGKANKSKQLVITDRVKELIKYKGFQVAPAEIEALLIGHAKVADAAVIGIKDEHGNETPRAYVVPASGCQSTAALRDEINDYTKKHLANFKWLRGGIEFIDVIPKSASGKILRRTLVERYNK